MIWFGGKWPSIEGLEQLHASNMPHHLGIEFIDCGDDWIRARMPVDARTMQPYGRLHGGASLALAETLGSAAGCCCVDPAKFVAVGVAINANHIRPAMKGWIYGTATPEAIGRTTQVWSIRIVDEADKLICVSRMTAAVIPTGPK